jgi:hypothetical protein
MTHQQIIPSKEQFTHKIQRSSPLNHSVIQSYTKPHFWEAHDNSTESKFNHNFSLVRTQSAPQPILQANSSVSSLREKRALASFTQPIQRAMRHGKVHTGGLRNNPLKIKGHKFASTEEKDGQIYAIYQNHDLANDINGAKVKHNQGDIVYVGQTVQKDVGDRFIQHVNEDDDRPWHKTLWPFGTLAKTYTYQSDDDDNDWPYYPRELSGIKEKTNLEISAEEEYYYEEHGGLEGKLLNKIQPLKKSTFTIYKNPSTFRGAGFPSHWEPKQ